MRHMGEDAGHSILDVVTPEELEELRAFVRGDKPVEEFENSSSFATLYNYYKEDGVIPSAVGGAGGVISLAKWVMRRAIDEYAPELLPVEEGGRERWAEHEWRKELARAKSAWDDGGLSMADEPKSKKASAGGVDAYADYMAQRTAGPKRVKEANIMREGYVKELRKLLEAEVDQAESLIAARGFSQEIQSMVEKLGRLMNEDLPAVSEQMRNSFGPDVATGFENQTTTVLQSVMDSLRSGKQDIDNSVAEISSGGVPVASTDMEDPEANDLDLGLGDDDLDLDLDLDMDDEFGGADAVAGPDEEPLGRAKKESVESLKRKIAEARRMVEKARKIKGV